MGLVAHEGTRVPRPGSKSRFGMEVTKHGVKRERGGGLSGIKVLRQYRIATHKCWRPAKKGDWHQVASAKITESIKET